MTFRLINKIIEALYVIKAAYVYMPVCVAKVVAAPLILKSKENHIVKLL